MHGLMFTYFWLLCALWVGGGGAIMFHSQLKPHVAAGLVEARAEKRFVVGWALWMTGPAIGFWLLQMTMSGAPSPQYMTWPEPQRSVAVGLTVVCWAALLWWVWLSDGAVTLATVAWVSIWQHAHYAEALDD